MYAYSIVSLFGCPQPTGNIAIATGIAIPVAAIIFNIIIITKCLSVQLCCCVEFKFFYYFFFFIKI